MFTDTYFGLHETSGSCGDGRHEDAGDEDVGAAQLSAVATQEILRTVQGDAEVWIVDLVGGDGTEEEDESPNEQDAEVGEETPSKENSQLDTSGDGNGEPPRKGGWEDAAESDDGKPKTAAEIFAENDPEVFLPPLPIVKRRMIGGTHMNIVLCEGVDEDDPVVADVMSDSEVVAVAVCGGSEEEREAAEKNCQSAGIKLAFIDMSEEDPRFYIAIESAEAQRSFEYVVKELEPLSEALAAAERLVRVDEIALSYRDELQAVRIQKIIDENEGAASIGVVTNFANYMAVGGVGEEVAPEEAEELAVEAKQSMDLRSLAVEASRAGDLDKMRVRIEQAVLSEYMRQYLQHRDLPLSDMQEKRKADLVAMAFTGEQRTWLLAMLGDELADSSERLIEKLPRVRRAFLQVLAPQSL